jgi:anti-anti-sigma regulatory factor
MAVQPSIEIEIYSAATCMVTLRRDHDLASRLGVEQALALAATHRYTLVDLSYCTFLDAAVMGALLRAASVARHAEGALELIVPASSLSVRRLLELTGAPAILPFHSTRAEAIASVESAARLRAHRPRTTGLRRVRARIQRLEAQTEASRARRMAGLSNVTVLRARVESDTGSLAAPVDRSLPIDLP